MIKEDEPPPSLRAAGVVGGVPGGVPGGRWVAFSAASSVNPAAVPKVATPQRVRVSQGVSQGLLIHEVKPDVSAAGTPGAYSG